MSKSNATYIIYRLGVWFVLRSKHKQQLVVGTSQRKCQQIALMAIKQKQSAKILCAHEETANDSLLECHRQEKEKKLS